jgi:phage N-6-adenine-methyltransferase
MSRPNTFSGDQTFSIAPLDRNKRRDVAAFEPSKTKELDAQADAIIAFAQKLRDWPLLEAAVDHKIGEQEEFVRWWRDNVTVHHGAGRGKKSADRGTFSMADAEKQTGIKNQLVSKWAKRLQDLATYRATLFGAAWRKAMAEKGQTDQRGASGTGENEWYTPDEYLDAARDVLGEIDLDPASSDVAQEKIRAGDYFTKEDDGLSKEWHGRVWLNPPFAQPHIAEFVSKMVEQRIARNVTAGIMLTHNYTDTSWFHEAAGIADAICFTRGRVKFYDAAGTIAAPTQGQAFFYFGDEVERFAARFTKIGFVVTPFEAANGG